MSITILQTADAKVYSKMLEITGKTAVEYAGVHHCQYVSHVGIIRGFYPWQATFNRIMLIADMIKTGATGWLLYLDADSYICSLTFDLREYLADKGDYALIAALSGAQPQLWWNINDGVFLLNLDHPKTNDIVASWLEKFMAVPEFDLKRAYTWNMISGGQALLQSVLQEDEGLRDVVYVDEHSKTINSPHAVFVRQVLRAEGNIGFRLNKLREDIAASFDRGKEGGQPVTLLAADAAACNEEFMRAIYTCLFMREPDAIGFVAALERLSTHRTSYAKEISTFLKSDEFATKLPIFLQVFQGSQDFDELIGSLAASRWRREQRLKTEAKEAIAIGSSETSTEKPIFSLFSRLGRKK